MLTDYHCATRIIVSFHFLWNIESKLTQAPKWPHSFSAHGSQLVVLQEHSAGAVSEFEILRVLLFSLLNSGGFRCVTCGG